ncbi:MAG: citrate/2-methylcitrate synthase, partial [Angelakisella sp.]
MAVNQIIDFSSVTPQIQNYGKLCVEGSSIPGDLFSKYQVNRGLRDLNGNGVLTGLTRISEIQSSELVDGQALPCEGKLFYRGIDIERIVEGFSTEKRFGFEETTYLLLFGRLPNKA